MPRNLAHAVSNARPARASSGVHRANGGTTAPAGSSRGPTTGLSSNRAFNTNHPSYVAQPSKPAPSAPAAAPAPAAPTGMPWDARAQQEFGAAQTKYNDTIAELQGNWATREQFYGFGANGANNPYSQASLLAKHHEWNERGRSNASGLQAFAGSNVNAEREEVGRYTTSYEQLLQAYEAEKAQNQRKEEQAKHEEEEGEENAQLGAIERAQQTEPEPVAAPGGGNKPGLGGDPAHPNAYRAGVGAGKSKPQAPPGYHAYKGPGNQWWFAPNS